MSEPSPSEERHPPARPPIGCAGWAGIVAVSLVVLVALGLGALAGRFTAPATPATTTIVHAGPATLTAIRDLARLQTAEFHMERVIDLRERQPALFGLVESEDAILLVAAARITAGVDLQKIGEDALVVSEDRLSVRATLPAPEIFDAALDNARTYVHTRQTDTLAERRESLETQARQKAEEELVSAAKGAGILDHARDNARDTLETLLRSLGYQKVEVRFEDE
ncbi:MAG: DUF4230 domain-containing protein [Polyangiaceae bacterium]